jgi:hypothetical protein
MRSPANRANTLISGSEMSTTKGMTSSYDRDSKTQQEDFIHYLDTLLGCINATVAEEAHEYSIIDYGCSLGANSVLAMNRLIQYVHEHKSIKSFSAYHNDLPTNDFNALLRNLRNSTNDYQHIPGCQVFTQLVPSSFFQQVVPDRRVDLGFTMAAVHWLTRIPDSDYRDAVFLSDVNQQAQVDLLDQAAKDWQSFVKARTKEIKPGGLLFIMALASEVNSAGCREVSTAGLAWAGEDHDRLVYRLPKPMPDGRITLYLTPLELLDRLAKLIPQPRRHRHRYHGVFAPNAPLRAQVTALLDDSPADAPPTTDAPDPTEPSTRPPHAYLWAMLITRIYETFPLACPVCGATMRIIAFITETAPIHQILDHIGEPHQPPPIHPPRGPPDWIDADEQVFLDEDLDQDRYEIDFDQRLTW